MVQFSKSSLFTLLALNLINTVYATECGQDVLVDDFSVVRTFNAPNNEVKRLNALNGDWGQLGGSFAIDTDAKTLTITAESVPEDQIMYPNPLVNPGTQPTFNYFYTQFNDQKENFDLACFDARNYNGLRLTIKADAGSDFNITLTQRKVDDCSVRTFDSEYKKLTDYYTTPGQEQEIFIPFSDFTTDLGGNAFNLQWLKDVTIVNMQPDDAQFVLKNVYLTTPDCDTSSSSSSSSSPSSPSTSTASTSSKTSTPTSRNSANSKNSSGLFVSCLVALGALAVFVI